MMLPRLQLLRQFLSDDGSIWVSIDDDEQAYLKVLMDEVFGRKNFIRTVVWQKRTSPDARVNLGDAQDYILVYARNKDAFQKSANKIKLSSERAESYKNPDNDPRGPWASTDLTGQTGHATPEQFYSITLPSGNIVKPPKDRCWAIAERTFLSLREDNRIWFGVNGNSRPRQKKFLSEASGMYAWSWWDNKEVGHNQEAKKEILTLLPDETAFSTPKPERLIKRILDIATKPGDLVLDSFLGSGTTAAVAHKMSRKYIGIEMGEHAKTHCWPRMKAVVDGELGGISNAVKWEGGGGFSFYKVSEPVFDEFGLINPQVEFETLAAYVWQSETEEPSQPRKSPFLGEKNGVGVYLLFNDVLGSDDNVLNYQRMKQLLETYPFEGEKVIYADACVGISDVELKRLNVTFKQIPFDIKQ